MPSFGGIQAGKAFIKLTINDSEFQRGLTGSLRRFDNFGKSLISIGSRFAVASAAFAAPMAASLKLFAARGAGAASELRRAIDAMKESGLRAATAIGQAMAPSIVSMADAVAKVLPGLITWVDANKSLIAGVPLVTAAIFGLSAAVAALGVAMRGIALVLGAIALLATSPQIAALLVLAGAIGVLGTALKQKLSGGRDVAATDGETESVNDLARSYRNAQEALKGLNKERKNKTPLNIAIERIRGEVEEGLVQRHIGDIRRRQQKVFGIDKGIGGGPTAFFNPFAQLAQPLALAIAGKVFTENIRNRISAITGQGKPGFDISQRNIESFTRGTFQGRLAPQIFGGGGSIPQILNKTLEENKKMLKKLESIDLKIGIGPAHKFGLA